MKYEVGGVMTPKNGTTTDLTVTTASVLVSVDTKVDDYLLTRSTVDTPKPSYQPSADTS